MLVVLGLVVELVIVVVLNNKTCLSGVGSAASMIEGGNDCSTDFVTLCTQLGSSECSVSFQGSRTSEKPAVLSRCF